MRRICPKCGSDIPAGEPSCPTCRELEELNKQNRKKLTCTIYYSVLTISSFFAAFLLLESVSFFAEEMRSIPRLMYIPEMAFSYLLIPMAFMLFVIMIIIRERSQLMIILPATGITAAVIQALTNMRGFTRSFTARDGYYYGMVTMELMVLVLVIVYFVFMINMIRYDYTLGQSRWLIVAAFVLVFSRLVLKVSIAGDFNPISSGSDIMEYADGSKAYILFAAALLNVKKRYLNSKKTKSTSE